MALFTTTPLYLQMSLSSPFSIAFTGYPETQYFLKKKHLNTATLIPAVKTEYAYSSLVTGQN
jgi:hypothetical protein